MHSEQKQSVPADEVIRTVAETALSILDKNGIAMEQCVGVGIGVPGTVDRKKGIVRYSNNIRWEDVAAGKGDVNISSDSGGNCK